MPAKRNIHKYLRFANELSVGESAHDGLLDVKHAAGVSGSLVLLDRKSSVVAGGDGSGVNGWSWTVFLFAYVFLRLHPSPAVSRGSFFCVCWYRPWKTESSPEEPERSGYQDQNGVGLRKIFQEISGLTAQSD